MGGGGGGGRARNVLPCVKGGAQKVSDPRFSHFVAPLPVSNGWSLYIIESARGGPEPLYGGYPPPPHPMHVNYDKHEI